MSHDCATNDDAPCVFCEMETYARMRNLEINMAVVAGLCWSYWLGWTRGEWEPGCGRGATDTWEKMR